jgi:hypothetical protein
MANEYFSTVCFADGGLIQIPKRVYVGECIMFCSSECRDRYLGPKPEIDN